MRRASITARSTSTAARTWTDCTNFLRKNDIKVLDAPAEYPQYAPGYYAVYFEDADGLKFEVVHMPEFPT